MPPPEQSGQILMRRSTLDALLRRRLQGNSCAKAMHRCAFLAVWPEISAALKKGYTAKLIWETLHDNGVITCEYPWFSRLIKQQRTKEDVALRQAQHKDERVKSGRLPIRAGDAKDVTVLQSATLSVCHSQGTQDLPPGFGQARADLTLDDFFGLSGTNIMDALK